MKKILPAVIIAILAFSGCSGSLVKNKAPQLTAEGQERETRSYAGTSTRSRYFCDENDNCKKCDITAPITVDFDSDGSVVIEQTADCMGITENGCYTKGTKCQYTITGTYTIADGKITLDKCNGPSISTEGQSYFDSNKIHGSVLCKYADRKIVQLEWNDVPRAP